MTKRNHTATSPRALSLLAPALAFALYLPSTANPLVWDDEIQVPEMRGASIARAFGRESESSYRRPLVLLSYVVQDRAGLSSPEALHLANAAFHSAATALVQAVARALACSPAAAAAAALVFAFHPLQSGSVAYVSGRTDLLAAALTLAACLFAMGGRAWSAAALALLAPLAKESGLVAGPLASALLWRVRLLGLGPAPPGASTTLAGVAAPALASAAVLAAVWPGAATSNVDLGLRLRGAGTTFATLAGLLVWPSGLHLDRLTPVGGGALAVVGAAVAVAACACAALLVRGPRTAWATALAAAWLCYLPVCGLVPVYPGIAETYVFTGEQFVYLPLGWLAVAAASGAENLARRFGSALPVLAAACVLAAAWTPSVLARQREFASADAVYEKSLANSPSPRACFNLGALRLRERRDDDGVALYERCLGLAPHDGGAWGQLAIAYQRLGRRDDAASAYARAVELAPKDANLWSNYATLDANGKRYGDARRKWERALALDPGHEAARSALARLEAAGL